MSYELKEGQGSLFVNDKGGNDKRRDRRGEINIGGTIYRLSGWIRKDRNGDPWLSLQADPKESTPAAAPKVVPPVHIPSDEPPF